MSARPKPTLYRCCVCRRETMGLATKAPEGWHYVCSKRGSRLGFFACSAACFERKKAARSRPRWL